MDYKSAVRHARPCRKSLIQNRLIVVEARSSPSRGVRLAEPGPASVARLRHHDVERDAETT